MVLVGCTPKQHDPSSHANECARTYTHTTDGIRFVMTQNLDIVRNNIEIHTYECDVFTRTRTCTCPRTPQ